MNQKTWLMPRTELVEHAVTLWNLDWIKAEWTKIFLAYDDKEYRHPEVEKIVALIKKVIEHSRTINVTSRDVFETLIEDMAMEIYVWLKSVWYKLEKFERRYYEEALNVYVNHIYWTTSGRIDYERIINKFWDEKKFPSEFTRFFELSVFSFEEKLKAWFAEVKKTVVDFIHSLIKERCRALTSTDNRVEHEYDYYLLAYWHYRLTRGMTRVPIEDLTVEYGRKFEHYIVDDKLSEANMFSLSAFYGHYYSLRYFWERMIDEESIRYLNKVLIHTFDRETGWNFYGLKYEVISFFFRSMNADRWERFLDSLHRGEVPLILVAVVQKMPHREFYFPMMDIIKTYIPKAADLSAPMKEHVFKALVDFMKHDHEWTRHGQEIKKIVQEIFRYAEYDLY